MILRFETEELLLKASAWIRRDFCFFRAGVSIFIKALENPCLPGLPTARLLSREAFAMHSQHARAFPASSVHPSNNSSKGREVVEFACHGWTKGVTGELHLDAVKWVAFQIVAVSGLRVKSGAVCRFRHKPQFGGRPMQRARKKTIRREALLLRKLTLTDSPAPHLPELKPLQNTAHLVGSCWAQHPPGLPGSAIRPVQVLQGARVETCFRPLAAWTIRNEITNAQIG